MVPLEWKLESCGHEWQPSCRFGDIPTLIEYNANSTTDSLEVNDGDRVVFHCKAEGNPRPELSIKGHRSKESLTLHETTTGTYTKNGEINKPMRCQDSDNYSCVADNRVGSSDKKSIAVFVKCGPEFAESSQNRKDFTHPNATDLVVMANIVGYPPPTEYTLTKLVNQTGRTTRDVSTVEVDKLLYKVDYISVGPGLGTVVLLLFDLLDDDSGQYALVIKNGIGDGLVYSFTVTVVSGNPCQPTNTCDQCYTAVAVGVTVVCGLVLSVLTFVLGVQVEKRRLCKKKTSKQVVMLKQSPDYEDHSNPLAEAYVGLDEIHMEEVRRQQGPQQDDGYENLVSVPSLSGPQHDDGYETPVSVISQSGPQQNVEHEIQVLAQGTPQQTNTYETSILAQGVPQQTNTYETSILAQGTPQQTNTYETSILAQGTPQQTNTYEASVPSQDVMSNDYVTEYTELDDPSPGHSAPYVNTNIMFPKSALSEYVNVQNSQS